MRQRWLSYLTLLFTLLLLALGVVWARSYLQNETLIRVGGGRAMALDCIRGEVSFWIAAAPDNGPTRYARETIDVAYGVTARELFQSNPPPRQLWFMGFGYAEPMQMPSGIGHTIGTARCIAAPLWFVALLLGLLPGWRLWRHAQQQQARGAGSASVCRRCGAEFGADNPRCPVCGFPAFVPSELPA